MPKLAVSWVRSSSKQTAFLVPAASFVVKPRRPYGQTGQLIAALLCEKTNFRWPLLDHLGELRSPG